MLTRRPRRRNSASGRGQAAARGVGDQRKSIFRSRMRRKCASAMPCSTDPVFYVVDLGDLPKVEGVALDGLVGYETVPPLRLDDRLREARARADRPREVHAAGRRRAWCRSISTTALPIVQGDARRRAGAHDVDTGSRSSLTMHSPFVREHKLVATYHASPESRDRLGRRRCRRAGSRRASARCELGDQQDRRVSPAISTPATRARSPIRISPEISAAACSSASRSRSITRTSGCTSRRMRATESPMRSIAADCGCSSPIGRAAVADVARDSAAARRVCATNDRIVAIDGEAVDRKSLVASGGRSSAELPVGTKLKVDRVRDGKKAHGRARARRSHSSRMSPSFPLLAGTMRCHSTRQNAALRYRDSGTCARNG